MRIDVIPVQNFENTKIKVKTAAASLSMYSLEYTPKMGKVWNQIFD